MGQKGQSITFTVRCELDLVEDFISVSKKQGKTRNQAIVELMELFAYHDEEEYIRWKTKFAAKEFHFWKSKLNEIKEKNVNSK